MESNHFLLSEILERDRLTLLFNEYFVPKGCTALKTTPIESFLSYDAEFISGNTPVVAEIKIRSIPITKYWNSTMIEFPKWKCLHERYLQSDIPLYIVEYESCFALWNLTKIFDNERLYPLDTFFIVEKCTKNCETYSRNEKEKYVRYIPFCDAIIVDKKDFKQMTHNEHIQSIYKK
jgi:hypothetical protein